jgi:hypothetical protein
MTEAQKDTIYIDVDDEITGIIDKVQDSPRKIVALVLPKRATVLQSIVNMKLLNRSAKTAKKSLVLITSEAGLMPLAGAVGVHVAKNLQSKPAIPAGPDTSEIPESLVNEEEIDGDDEPDIDDKKAIGELAGVAAVAVTTSEPEEIINLDDEELTKAVAKPGKLAKTPKDNKLKVPNFERFRKWLILGGIALIVLLVGGYFALIKLPKATIAITTDSSDTTMNVAFTANTSTKTYDEAAKVVPAEMPSIKKTGSQSVPATGQKNAGTKAAGNVSMTAKKCSGNPFVFPTDVSSGTGVSVNGQTYITQANATFHGTGTADGCYSYATDSSIPVTAQNTGATGNTGAATFTVAGRSDVTATGSTSGGTDNIVKVVSQSDIDAAKAKLNAQAESDAAKTELTNTLIKDGMMPISSSFAADGPNVTTTPNAGDQADNVTVNSTTTYTMLGVNQDDLNKLVTAQAKGQIDSSKQTVQSTGLDKATFVVQGKTNPQVTVTTSVTIGPNLDTDAIKKEIAGKKKGETIDIIQSRPSIKAVTVNYSPFWVIKTPANPNKVTITFNKAGK